MRKVRGRMEQFIDWVERVLSLIFVPATLYGGAGALMRRGRGERTFGQVISEVFGGALTAHMLTPVIYANIPPEWQSVSFFLVGWGGLELVGRLYEAVAQGLENRIRGRVEGKGRGEE